MRIWQKQMDTKELKVIFERFLRAFAAGGVSSVMAMLALGVQIKSWDDLGQFAVALSIAFMTGGLMALDKLIRYTPESGIIENLKK
jgi:hypothetical protein